MIKLIAADMDGTLLNEKRVISDFNACVIKTAQKQGVRFIISSGRPRSAVTPLLAPSSA